MLVSCLHNTRFFVVAIVLFFIYFIFWFLFTINSLKNYHDLGIHNQQTLSTTTIIYINYFLIYTKYCNANNNIIIPGNREAA